MAARQQTIRDFYVSGSPREAKSLLKLIRAPKGYGVFASIGPRIQYAIYGRDSVEVAEDLLQTHGRLVREILCMLASLQGVQHDRKNEEEPGKIHHEFRKDYFGGHGIPRAAMQTVRRMRTDWGQPHKPLLYYGSFDSTPLFIRLVHRYTKMYGPALLSQKVTGKDGIVRPFRDHVHMATEWLAGKVASSSWQLFEDHPLNAKGLPNQEWEDSSEAYVHTDGSFANTASGVAAVELQGYAYDALLAAAGLVASNEQEATVWREMARQIQAQTLELLWMPKKHYFAMGLDRDPQTNKTRQITTLNANGALLLNSHLLLDLPAATRKPFVDGIVAMIGSSDFMTGAGVRVRALREANIVKYADYHGSLVTWPKETYDIAVGLRRHGHDMLSVTLEDTILDAVAQAGEFYEFFLVDKSGKVKYHYRREDPGEPAIRNFSASVLPEAGQAWTISAVLAIVASRHPTEKNKAIQKSTLDNMKIKQKLS